MIRGLGAPHRMTVRTMAVGVAGVVGAARGTGGRPTMIRPWVRLLTPRLDPLMRRDIPARRGSGGRSTGLLITSTRKLVT